MSNSLKESPSPGQYFFICGNDDYLVDRAGRKLYSQHSSQLSNDFSCEIIDSNANNVSQAETIINHFITSAQMPSLFAENKVIWLRNFNLLADSPTGRAESTKSLLETLHHILSTLNYSTTSIIITATPVDKRTRAFKALKNTPFFQLIEDVSSSANLSSLIAHECKAHNIQITPDALDAFLEKINGNSRLALQEIQKLITFAGDNIKVIDLPLVTEMISQFGEADFFEFADAFFSLDLNRSLDALTRYFFTQKEARPLISSVLNRLNLLIQLRTLLDSQAITTSSHTLNSNTLKALASKHNFPPTDPSLKSSFNIFTQNPWYLSKLAPVAKKIALKKLIDFQFALINAFEKILHHSQPLEQESIMRQLVMQCLL